MQWVKLGDFIEEFNERNAENKYGVDVLRGVTSSGKFDTSKANTDGLNFSNYKIVKKDFFAYNPSRINIGSIAKCQEDICIISPMYIVFKIKQSRETELLSDFLMLWFIRSEFQRSTLFYAAGSVRDTFSFDEMCRVKIPLLSIDEQKQVVAAWRGLKNLGEQNEQMGSSLMELCQSYIEHLKRLYPHEAIGAFIKQEKEKNTNLEISYEQGIDINKNFITPQRKNSDLSSRVIVRHGQFAYCTQLNNANVAIAYREGCDCVVSPVYEVFSLVSDKILPQYLFLWLIRPEFGRFVYWGSKGSAYEFLQYDNLANYRIPIPPIEIQQAIVEIYNCAKTSKYISESAKQLASDICPALMRQIIGDNQ